MKKLNLVGFFVVLFPLSSFATEFYECTLPQADEYRVGISLETKRAGFFDNDTTSLMDYKRSRKSAVNPEVDVFIYEGKDLGGDGGLRLEFNTQSKRIKLSTVENDGTIELLGFASCKLGEAWDLN